MFYKKEYILTEIFADANTI